MVVLNVVGALPAELQDSRGLQFRLVPTEKLDQVLLVELVNLLGLLEGCWVVRMSRVLENRAPLGPVPLGNRLQRHA